MNFVDGSPWIGHLKEISFLSDGTLVGLMSIPAGSSVQNGIHIIDPTQGTARLIWQEWDWSMSSMSVLRVPTENSSDCGSFLSNLHQRDLLYVVLWDYVIHEEGGPRPTRIELHETNGNLTYLAGFAAEAASSPGEPGLFRIDGALPGSKAACIRFDGQPLSDLHYDGQSTTYSTPVISSFSGPAVAADAGNNLVVGGPGMLPIYGQGAEPGDDTIELWLASDLSPRHVVSVLTADDTGTVASEIQLSPGFNAICLQTSRSGETLDLLKRHVLYIPNVWPPTIPAD